MTTYNRLLHRCTDDEVLLSGKFSTVSGITRSATNYWTVTLYRRREGDTIGGKVGTQFSSAIAGIAANGTVTLYDSETGLGLDSGDSLWATLETTGSPTTPTDARMTIVVQRKVT